MPFLSSSRLLLVHCVTSRRPPQQWLSVAYGPWGGVSRVIISLAWEPSTWMRRVGYQGGCVAAARQILWLA